MVLTNTNIMVKSHSILNFVRKTLWCSPLFAFQEYVITEEEIKILEQETLFTLMNAVLY